MGEYRKRNIAARLVRLGFNQATLAAEVGASRSFVGKLLRGERKSARLEPLICDHIRLRRRRLYKETRPCQSKKS